MTTKAAALRYARALFDVALQERVDLDQIDRELAAFDDLLAQQATLKKVLLNPAVPVQRKRAAVLQLASRSNTSTIVTKLLAMLAERDRLIVLPDLLASYRERVLDHRKIVRAEVVTAAPLPADRLQAIEQRLADATGRQVTLRATTDPAIIGGLVAKVGSTVYDGSITRQLEKMKQRLTESL